MVSPFRSLDPRMSHKMVDLDTLLCRVKLRGERTCPSYTGSGVRDQSDVLSLGLERLFEVEERSYGPLTGEERGTVGVVESNTEPDAHFP